METRIPKKLVSSQHAVLLAELFHEPQVMDYICCEGLQVSPREHCGSEHLLVQTWKTPARERGSGGGGECRERRRGHKQCVKLLLFILNDKPTFERYTVLHFFLLIR